MAGPTDAINHDVDYRTPRHAGRARRTDREFGITGFARVICHSRPSEKLVSHDGNVAGMTNVSTALKDAIKRIPGTQTLYFKLAGLRLPRSTENAFRHIVTENKWGVNDSVSGGGSDLYQTRICPRPSPNVVV